MNEEVVWFTIGPIPITNVTVYTVGFTWAVMALLVLLARLATRRSSEALTPWQNFMEIVVGWMEGQIREIARRPAAPYLPFVGTLFLFIAASNVLAVVPLFDPPTSKLSTTAALATCVFVAVPYFGIASQGMRNYLASYLKPVFIMLPFNVIGEVSRTIALAVRLFGNMLSGGLIAGVLLAFVPLFVPIVMHALGLLTGMIQAYIFAILATVYIAAGLGPRERGEAGAAEPEAAGRRAE